MKDIGLRAISFWSTRVATGIDVTPPGSPEGLRGPSSAHYPAATHLEHQFAGKVEEGDNPAPIEVAVGEHFRGHSEEDLSGGVCVHGRDHPAGERGAHGGGDQAEHGNCGIRPIYQRCEN